MKNTAHNTFKQYKKLRQLERKNKRKDKQKALVFWGNMEQSFKALN